MKTIKYIIACFALALPIGSATAATILQSGSNTIAFEAEIGDIDNSFDTALFGWEVDGVTTPLAGASGGSLVVATEDSTTAAPSNTITFDIDFTKTGNYNTWFRVAYTTQDYEDSRDSGANNDSFHYESGSIDDMTLSWTTMNSIPISISAWAWVNGSSIASVGTAGASSWLVSNREDGLVLDRIVLVHSDETATVSAAFLDGLSNNATAVPEPSSTVFLGLGGLALILRRRR
jgi:hypothetical protein